MSLQGATGLVGTAVGLGISLAALGLAFEVVDRSVARTQRQVGNSKRKGGRRRATDDIFDLGLTQRPAKKGRKFRNEFGSDFNIFEL